MSSDTPLILSLRAAVDASPDDVPLRLHLAELLLATGGIDDAVAHVTAALHRDPNSTQAHALMKRAMARRAGPAVPAASRVGAAGDEQPTERHSFNWAAAESQFTDVTQPRMFDPGDTGPLPVIPRYDVERPSVRLRDVTGMADMKRRLEAVWPAAVRDPRPRGFRTAGWRGGVVLYGPPGCGRDFLARAMAGEMGARFLAVTLAEGLDGWPGGIERVLRDAFAAARRAAPCVLFLDGIEAIGQQRAHSRSTSGTRAVVNQLLAELASTQTDEHVLVIAATDHPWDVDPALRRNGRFDRMVLVLPPDQPAREAILRRNLENRPVRGVKVSDLAKRTEDYSIADLAQLCATAAELALLDSVHTGQVRQIDSRDFEVALAEVRPSTGTWLAAARNVAMFANGDGSYDELHRYLKRRRMV